MFESAGEEAGLQKLRSNDVPDPLLWRYSSSRCNTNTEADFPKRLAMTHLGVNVPTQCWSSTVRARSTEAGGRLDFKQCATVNWDRKEKKTKKNLWGWGSVTNQGVDTQDASCPRSWAKSAGLGESCDNMTTVSSVSSLLILEQASEESRRL